MSLICRHYLYRLSAPVLLENGWCSDLQLGPALFTSLLTSKAFKSLFSRATVTNFKMSSFIYSTARDKHFMESSKTCSIPFPGLWTSRQWGSVSSGQAAFCDQLTNEYPSHTNSRQDKMPRWTRDDNLSRWEFERISGKRWLCITRNFLIFSLLFSFWRWENGRFRVKSKQHGKKSSIAHLHLKQIHKSFSSC